MDKIAKQNFVKSFQDLVTDILDKYEKYKPNEKEQVKNLLSELELVNKDLNSYDSFLKNLFDRSHKRINRLINKVDKVFKNKEVDSLKREYTRIINDILDKYEQYDEEKKAKIHNILKKLTELNKILKDYDLNILQKAIKFFDDNFGVK